MDIVILAVITIFIFIKLIKQFGKVDEDQKRDAIKNFITEQTKVSDSDKDQLNKSNIAVAISPGNIEKVTIIDEKSGKILDSLSSMLRIEVVKVLERTNSSAANFIAGATKAFEMIIEAFANSDLETLKPLLSEKLKDQFELVVNDRKSNGKIFNSKIFAVEKNEIIDAKIVNDEAFITVRFLSKQINYITNSLGEVIEGSKEQVNSLSDSWIFKKDINSPNPNWVVVSTNA